MGFDHQNIWCRLGLVNLCRSRNATQLHRDMGTRDTAVCRCHLHHLPGLRIVAVNMHVNARQQHLAFGRRGMQGGLDGSGRHGVFLSWKSALDVLAK